MAQGADLVPAGYWGDRIVRELPPGWYVVRYDALIDFTETYGFRGLDAIETGRELRCGLAHAPSGVGVEVTLRAVPDWEWLRATLIAAERTPDGAYVSSEGRRQW